MENNPISTDSLDHAYAKHVSSKEGKIKTVAHYLEGVNPEKAAEIKNSMASQVQEEYKIKEHILNLHKNTEETSSEIPTDGILITREDSKIQPQSKLRSFLKKVVGASLIFGAFSHGDGKKQVPKNFHFDSHLTNNEITSRLETVDNYLEDNSDLKNVHTDKHSIDSMFSATVSAAENTLKSNKEALTTLLQNKKEGDGTEEEILKTEELISKKQEWLNTVPHQKEVKSKEIKDYILNRNNIKTQRVIDQYHKYDAQKKWLENNIQSSDYLERLVIEFHGDRTRAVNEQKKRIEALQNDYMLESIESIRDSQGEYVTGYFNPENNRAHFPMNDLASSMGIHEFTHQSTEGNKNISNYAKNLYSNGIDMDRISNPDDILGKNQTVKEYISNPTELDARKKELEFELEKRGIKKYGEKFTKKHLEILWKLQSEGEIKNAFLGSMKNEDLIKIMNTVASVHHSTEDIENLS